MEGYYLKKEVMSLIKNYLDGKLSERELSNLAVSLMIKGRNDNKLLSEKEKRSLAIAIVDMVVLNSKSKKYYVSDNNLEDDLDCLALKECYFR